MITFYLTDLAHPNNFTDHFSEAFIGVLPTLFLLYILWDCIRYKEYSKLPVGAEENCYKTNEEKTQELDILKSRFWTTFAFFLLSITQMILFLSFIRVLTFSGQVNIYQTYQIFIIVSIFIFCAYRFIKWDFQSLRIYHA
jgi:hypothetical protein